jgi:(E)-4-hydroxy-3-methylbut-2-enyl-diphosphate synthase
LIDGIGDTIRVSLTGDSVEEVRVACALRDIASNKFSNLQIISCPSCSRSRIDVQTLVEKFIKLLNKKDLNMPYKVAIMGCEVNGPGEARDCDIGICGTKKGGLFIKAGNIKQNLNTDVVVEFLVSELRKLR